MKIFKTRLRCRSVFLVRSLDWLVKPWINVIFFFFFIVVIPIVDCSAFSKLWPVVVHSLARTWDAKCFGNLSRFTGAWQPCSGGRQLSKKRKQHCFPSVKRYACNCRDTCVTVERCECLQGVRHDHRKTRNALAKEKSMALLIPARKRKGGLRALSGNVEAQNKA